MCFLVSGFCWDNLQIFYNVKIWKYCSLQDGHLRNVILCPCFKCWTSRCISVSTNFKIGIYLRIFLQNTGGLLWWDPCSRQHHGDAPGEQVHQLLAAWRRLVDLLGRVHGPQHPDGLRSPRVRDRVPQERGKHHDEERHRCPDGRILILDVWFWSELWWGLPLVLSNLKYSIQ